MIGMTQNKTWKIAVKNKTKNQKIRQKLKRLNIQFVKSKEKVAYYYENINHQVTFSFNEEMTFYAASTIKILVTNYILDYKLDRSQKITITKTDLKPGTGILKEELQLPKQYTVQDLMKYCLVESDNTAYLKLVEWIGKENLSKYGKSLHAKHTFEGKDSFGIITCSDLKCYWQKCFELQKEYPFLKEWLANPRTKIINSKLFQGEFLRKYGSFDIAYHEAGIVLEENPYYLFILTQKSSSNKSKRFINRTAKELAKIHKLLASEINNNKKDKEG